MTFIYRHPLEDFITGFEAEPNPHHLAVLKRPTVISVMVHAGFEADMAKALQALPDVSCRFAGPGEWLLVSGTSGVDSLLRDVAALGAEKVSALDQSDGRVVMRIVGPRVRQILAKCLALDLHPDEFAIGRATNAQCCHVAANLARSAENTFEIMVMRSYAGFVFEELVEMGREFAMTTGFAD